VYSVTLRPPLSVAQTNRGSRELEAWEVERIAVLYQEGVPEFETMLIDNSQMTPTETASLILRSIRDSLAKRLPPPPKPAGPTDAFGAGAL